MDDPVLRLGSDWTARVDRFNHGGQASHEIHVFNPAGEEVGVFGKGGWINKHGHTGAPALPRNVFNTLNGANVNELRAQGRIAPRGQQDIRGFKYLGRAGSALNFLGGALMMYDGYQAGEAARRNGTSWSYEMLRRVDPRVGAPVPEG